MHPYLCGGDKKRTAEIGYAKPSETQNLAFRSGDLRFLICVFFLFCHVRGITSRPFRTHLVGIARVDFDGRIWWILLQCQNHHATSRHDFERDSHSTFAFEMNILTGTSSGTWGYGTRRRRCVTGGISEVIKSGVSYVDCGCAIAKERATRWICATVFAL